MQVALVGVGGAGCAAVDAILDGDRDEAVADAIAVDTSDEDLDSLQCVPRDRRVRIGADRTDDGTGGDAALAERILRGERGSVEAAVADVPVGAVDAFLVVAGLGGGTGGGCGPLLARSLGAITDVPVFGLALLPAADDGDSATRTAARTLGPFAAGTDGLVVFDADAFPEATPEERVDVLVGRLTPLLAAGDDGLSSATVVETLREGVTTLGYAAEDVDGAVDRDLVTGLVQRSTLSDLTLLATCASADRALVVATGPPDRIPDGGLDGGAAWVEHHADVADVSTGTVAGPGDHVGVLTVFAGVTDAPRLDRLRRVTDDDGDSGATAGDGSERGSKEDPEPVTRSTDGPPRIVVPPTATSGGRPHEGVRVAVAAVDGTLTANVAESLASELPALGGQVVLVAGDVSDRAARTLAATGITAVSVPVDGFESVAGAVGATPVVDPRSLSPGALGTAASVAVAPGGGEPVVEVEGPDGEVLVRVGRADEVEADPAGESSSGEPPSPDSVDRTPPDAATGPDAGDGIGVDPEGVTDPDTGDDVPTIDPLADAAPPSTVPTAPSVDLATADVRMGEYLGETDRATVRDARTSDGRRLAVKFPEFDEDTPDETVRRAFCAVDAWDGIDDHPNVAAVVDWGVDPRPWVAIERLDADYAMQEALPPARAAWSAVRIADAVERAHREGLVHLALHPGNVGLRVTSGGGFDVPKVTDWGLSRVLIESVDAFGGFPTAYAAPEQLDDGDGDLDTRTDVYQLGAVCYELFVGDPPFEGLSTGVMGKVLDERPDPPSERVPGVPPAVDEVIGRALEKDPADRYSDAARFRAALAALSPYE